MSRGLLIRLIGAASGTLAAVWLVRDWFTSGLPFLIVLNLIIAGCGAYAGWQLAALVEDLAGWRALSASPNRLAEPMIALPLAKSRAAKVGQIVAALAAEHVFAPDVPVAAELFGPIADRDEPPNQEVVLTALWEAEYYAPGFDRNRHMANLAFHDSKAEQDAELVGNQIADLSRLCGDALPISAVSIEHPLNGNHGPQPRCTVALDAGDQPIMLSYVPAAKYTSTVIHVAVAKALANTNSTRRLAWLWNDQGAWICALAPGGAERLNAAAGRVRSGHGGWDWVDESQPFEAGLG